jgi:hypothetical protein
MTFEDKKTCFLLSAINECGFLNLTVVYSRFNMENEETVTIISKGQILIAATVLLAVIIFIRAIQCNTRKDFIPQQPSEKNTCLNKHCDRKRRKQSAELDEPQTHRQKLNEYSPLACTV